MIRITRVVDEPTRAVLKIEGKIVAEAVATLRRECERLLDEGRAIDLDLSNVDYISQHALGILRQMHSPRLRLVNCSGFIEALLDGREAK